jgi:TRAP-type uncharacterized transport system substrate-binding protein
MMEQGSKRIFKSIWANFKNFGTFKRLHKKIKKL